MRLSSQHNNTTDNTNNTTRTQQEQQLNNSNKQVAYPQDPFDEKHRTMKDGEEEPDKVTVKEVCGMCSRLFLLLTGGAALGLGFAGASGCSFLEYEPAPVPPGVVDATPVRLQNITFATVGLYRYDPDESGCRKISDDFDNLGNVVTAARIGHSIGLIAGGVGLALLCIALFCCRFPCNRFLVSGLFVAAALAQILTFLMFEADFCTTRNFKNAPYPCTPSTGTWVSISIVLLYFVGSIMACCMPQPTPLFKRIMDGAKKDETDPFCCLCTKKKPSDEEEGKEEDGKKEENEDMETGESVALIVAKGGEEHAEEAMGGEKEKDMEKASMRGEKEKDMEKASMRGEKEKDMEKASMREGKDEDTEKTSMEGEEGSSPVDLANAEAARLASEAVLTTALAAARQGKQEEIEKQLELLVKYKEHFSEEEYEEKVVTLLHALPDPTTYDQSTMSAYLYRVESTGEKEIAVAAGAEEEGNAFLSSLRKSEMEEGDAEDAEGAGAEEEGDALSGVRTSEMEEGDAEDAEGGAEDRAEGGTEEAEGGAEDEAEEGGDSDDDVEVVVKKSGIGAKLKASAAKVVTSVKHAGTSVKKSVEPSQTPEISEEATF